MQPTPLQYYDCMPRDVTQAGPVLYPISMRDILLYFAAVGVSKSVDRQVLQIHNPIQNMWRVSQNEFHQVQNY